MSSGRKARRTTGTRGQPPVRTPTLLRELVTYRPGTRRPCPGPEGTTSESAGRGIGLWVMLTLGAVLLLYLFGFAVLILFPQSVRGVHALGVSHDTLEKLYHPLLWFLR